MKQNDSAARGCFELVVKNPLIQDYLFVDVMGGCFEGQMSCFYSSLTFDSLKLMTSRVAGGLKAINRIDATTREDASIFQRYLG